MAPQNDLSNPNAHERNAEIGRHPQIVGVLFWRPEAVRSWALSYEGIADGVSISISDLSGSAGTGNISVSTTARYGDTNIASATGHTYIVGDGCHDCLVQ